MEEITKKRKTTTSSAVKRKYNSKVYSPIRAELPKELVANFKLATKQQGVSVASVLKKSIEEYLKKYPIAKDE